LGRCVRAWRALSDDAAPSPERLFEQCEEESLVRQTLERLPARERVVMCMKLLDGMNQQEIADTLGFSKGYVSKLVTKAVARLRTLGWEVDEET
jgi:RNA polymerase sigma factor (sigma-70 family)